MRISTVAYWQTVSFAKIRPAKFTLYLIMATNFFMYFLCISSDLVDFGMEDVQGSRRIFRYNRRSRDHTLFRAVNKFLTLHSTFNVLFEQNFLKYI
jgi:hypothetical protein